MCYEKYVALQSSKRENDCLNIIKALCWMRHLGWTHALCIKISKMYVWDKVEGAPNICLKQENRKAQSWVQNSKPFHPHGWDSLNRAQLSNHQRLWRAVVWLFTAADMWRCSDHLDQQSGIQVFCGKRFMGLSLCGKVGNGNLKGGISFPFPPSGKQWMCREAGLVWIQGLSKNRRNRNQVRDSLWRKWSNTLRKLNCFMIFIISEASSHDCGTCTTGRELTVSMHHAWEVERPWGLVHVNLSFCISVSLTLRGQILLY